MPERSDEERAELARLADRYGGAEVERRAQVAGGFGPVAPMLAETLDTPLATVEETDWIAEPKVDGTRLIVQHFDQEIRADTRREVERSDAIPTVVAELQGLPDGVILDGELTFVTPTGQSRFRPIHTDPSESARQDLRPVLYAFDCLYAGENCCERPLTERKEILADVLVTGDHVVNTPTRPTDFGAYFSELTGAGEEGLVPKRRDSRYYPGVRSPQWPKVQDFTERDAVVVGYTAGRGSRAETFAALVQKDGETYLGRVGSGFTEADLREITESMIPVEGREVPEDAVGEAYTPVEPFVVAVKYQELTADGKLRAPVFLRRRPEKPIGDVRSVSGGA